MGDFDRTLAAVALAHHGIITLDDVHDAGGDRNDAALRLASGRWQLVHDRVYRLAGAPFTYESQVFAAVRAAGAGAVASHFCAARLHGIGFAKALTELSVPRGRFHRPQGIAVHTSTDLDRCEVVTVADCIPATDPNRTLLDMARRLKETSHKKAVKDARSRGLVDSHDGRVIARMDIAYVPNQANFEIAGPVHDDPIVAAKDDERDHELRTRHGWFVRRIPHRMPLDEPRRFLAIVRETLALRPACDDSADYSS